MCFGGMIIMKRLTFFASLAVILLTGVTLIEYHDKPITAYYYHVVTVQSGDTLWSIAEKHSAPQQDIRHLIAAIKQTNCIDQSVQIYPGQTLQIPVQNINAPRWANILN